MEVYFFFYSIKIHDESSKYDDVGSTIKCWVYSKGFNEAEIVILKNITSYDWKLGDCIEKKKVVKEDYNNREEKKYLEKAIELGFFSIIDTHPKKK